MTQAAPLLSVRGVRKTYETPQGALTVLDGVSLDLAAGETLALMGESGSGKSTLLHLVAGLDAADAGEIFLDGADIAMAPEAERARVRRDTVGVVFQQFNLIPSLTAGANLSFQARLAGRSPRRSGAGRAGGRFDAARRDALAARLGLAELLDRYPEQLSGGQQQRVAIGRALLARPRLLLADEPTGNLDEATADSVLGLMLELVAETGCALLVATHSERIAARLDRRLILRAGRLG